MMTITMKIIKKTISALAALASIATLAFSNMGNAFAAEEYCDDELRSMANEVAILVNEVRAENGLDPLYVVPYLNELSDIRAVETIEDFSHSRGGKRFTSIIDTSVVDYFSAAENIACGYGTAAETFQQWMNSDGHKKNILNPHMTHIGIGVVYDSESDYGWYWQQMFVETDQVLENQYLPTDYEVVPKAEGDINGDGVVDSFDYLGLCEYIYKTKNDIPVYMNEAQIETADCFRDGIITEADAKVMVRYLLGEYTKLPFEF